MDPATVPFDAQLLLFVYAARSGAFTDAALALSALGSGWVMLAVVPLYVVGRLRRWLAFLTGSVVVSTIVVFALKLFFGRTRPCIAVPGVHALCAVPTDPSFPSGHAGGSFTFAAFAFVAMWGDRAPRAVAWRIALSVLALGLACGVAWSRVYLGVHFPADVVAGAALGSTVGALGGLRYLHR